jgi:hypothetical protein
MLVKSKLFLGGVFTLVSFLLLLTYYLKANKSLSHETIEMKKKFLRLSKLPDLAIQNESLFARHRSLQNMGDIYSVDGVLREYDKSTFSINKASSL